MTACLSPNQYSNGIKLGLLEERAVDDYYKTKLSKATSKPKAKAKLKANKPKARPSSDHGAVALTTKDMDLLGDEPVSTTHDNPLASATSNANDNDARENSAITEGCFEEATSSSSPLGSRAKPSIDASRIVEASGSDGEFASCSSGGCPMFWARHAASLEYKCFRCNAVCRGARWHCATHQEDCCGKCCAAPATASCSSGATHIVEASWRNHASMRKAVKDPLGDLLAAQERVLQQRRLDLREEIEARETRKSSHDYGCCRNATTSHVTREAQGPVAAVGALDNPVEVKQPSLMDENAAKMRPVRSDVSAISQTDASQGLLTRTCDLTLVLAGDLLDELARGYSQEWFQDLVHQCACECRGDTMAFAAKLHDVAFEVQKPILENWGFDGNIQGVYDVTSIIQEYSGKTEHHVPTWFTNKRDTCLRLLYGGERSGMLN